ncbi:hypothetical protein D3C80_2153030 [compost metagenome]
MALHILQGEGTLAAVESDHRCIDCLLLDEDSARYAFGSDSALADSAGQLLVVGLAGAGAEQGDTDQQR